MPKNRTKLAKEMINSAASFEDEEIDEIEEEITETSSFLADTMKSHTRIRSSFVGNLTELTKNGAKTVLQATQEMSVDEFGLVHNGFIFGSAEYAAAAAVNEENFIVIGCRSKFFAPAKVGDIISFEAKGRFEDARKREIKVTGTINDVKVFEGIFQAVILEHHILKTTIEELQAELKQ